MKATEKVFLVRYVLYLSHGRKTPRPRSCIKMNIFQLSLI